MNERDAAILELVKSLQQDFEIWDFAEGVGPRTARKALRRYTQGHHKTLIEIARLLQIEEEKTNGA